MKKRLQLTLLLFMVLCLFTACRGGNSGMTTVPTTAATMPATQATTMPTTQPETTMDNGNGPLDTAPQDGESQETTDGANEAGGTTETNGTNQAQR